MTTGTVSITATPCFPLSHFRFPPFHPSHVNNQRSLQPVDLTLSFYSTTGSNPSFPLRQCCRYGGLFHSCNNTQTQRPRSRRSSRRCRYPSHWVWPDIRPQLLPSQPIRHGRPPYGSFRLLGSQPVRSSGPASD